MRRVGVIVDGDSEYKALPQLFRRIPDINCQVIGTLLAPIPPTATPGVIARSCKSGIEILTRKQANDIVVLIDREDDMDCPGERALAIGSRLTVPANIRGYVVLKDRMFENWLVADLNALKAFPARYKITPAVERKVVQGKADSVDALRFMKDVTNPSYAKTRDSKKILEAADPMSMAENSRSFRRLLRILGSAAYKHQTLRPA
jgi:hypothetical protein